MRTFNQLKSIRKNPTYHRNMPLWLEKSWAQIGGEGYNTPCFSKFCSFLVKKIEKTVFLGVFWCWICTKEDITPTLLLYNFMLLGGYAPGKNPVKIGLKLCRFNRFLIKNRPILI